MKSLCVFGILSFILLISKSSVDACKGCVNIDEFNFEKIVPKFEVILAKFDVAFPYGKKHDTFTSLAGEIVDNKNIILAQVGIKDYGEKDNLEFSKKFGIQSKDDLPALRLFVQSEDEPFVYDKNMPWTDESLKKFIRDHTNIYLGLAGCLEAFDKLAMKFIAASDKEAVLKQTEDEAKQISNEREKSIATTYIKFMKKVIENGTSFISQEEKRLNKIISEGKINDKKKEELSHRLNMPSLNEGSANETRDRLKQTDLIGRGISCQAYLKIP
ncbi:hypothetical protein NQ318_016532 [Aromia moschata]|uniref:Uncharacterized protein n=1 Tax=Aromia moschata TaxID=1265417 RepID=A0AAV8YX37_9CUCU|nr:hypothetical protein NQ318_016532 [Aromia moschata]